MAYIYNLRVSQKDIWDQEGTCGKGFFPWHKCFSFFFLFLFFPKIQCFCFTSFSSSSSTYNGVSLNDQQIQNICVGTKVSEQSYNL
jgi:hypothetical protein